MALIQCSECKTEISKSAEKCPKCGHPNPKSKHLSGSQVLIGLLLAAGFIWWQAGGGMDKHVANEVQKIENKVAADALEQYQIAKRDGDKVQICVTAGFLSAAYLQAKDEDNYKKAKAIQSADCKKAGLPN